MTKLFLNHLWTASTAISRSAIKKRQNSPSNPSFSDKNTLTGRYSDTRFIILSIWTWKHRISESIISFSFAISPQKSPSKCWFGWLLISRSRRPNWPISTQLLSGLPAGLFMSKLSWKYEADRISENFLHGNFWNILATCFAAWKRLQ